ncbi:hypothetical protein KI809_01410 [Geobacter pelophilus]|uniref:DUF2834 domain-containing protein n=1 Tax=Geoanaerobacter pelophilus TaxID=60036 RepID=A0AAW4KYE7_9BACT|nr:hypothetical protein [Geoanaerobacter pelophilus]MBT0662942.1 hypothetical protein [Geoanaerobacter pelophilus]
MSTEINRLVPFRILLIAMIICIIVYTSIVGLNHGWNLFPQFFGDMVAMTWPGQFNFDFMCLLIFSGLWLAWRHQFSPGGIIIGMLGFFGGTMFLAPYLLFVSFKAKGDMNEILLGSSR